MSKDKISDYSATANSNTDIGGINIDEGCAPSGINDAIRTLMKQLKDWQSGSQDVYIHPAGSASVPSITATGDTNTGLFFPAADTVGITTGGTERARIDSSGNLGLGVTPSVWSNVTALQVKSGSLSAGSIDTYLSSNAFYSTNSPSGWKYITSTTATQFYQNASGGEFVWRTAASGTAGNAITFTQAMTLDASGNLAVGISSPTFADGKGIHLNNSSGASRFHLTNNTTGTTATDGSEFTVAGSDLYIINNESATMQFWTAATERARITSSGNLLAGTTSDSGYHVLQKGNSGDWASATINTASTTPQGHLIRYTGASPNNTGSSFLLGLDSGNTTRFSFYSNGGLANFSGNNVNLSDRREKTNFAPAGEYLSKICAIPVQTFNYIDQNLEEDAGLTLGVVAQDVQAVAPELVMESNWGTKEEPKMRLSIYQTDLQYALMKCIQEQQAIITQLQADVAALKGQA